MAGRYILLEVGRVLNVKVAPLDIAPEKKTGLLFYLYWK
jgi:hypothetical protein